MIISALKCIHLVLTLGLLGSAVCCLILTGFQKLSANSTQSQLLTTLNRATLWLLLLATATGTLLVYPKHFTFHTPWIQAAYLLVFLSGTLVSMLLVFRGKYRSWLWSVGYLVLLVLLVIVVHDAVSKTTFL